MDQWNDELTTLFARYKAAVPDPEASANFMPGLWQKIEARQGTLFRVKRLTQIFVATAAAICLLFATMLGVSKSDLSELRGSYVDALVEYHPTENLAAMGIIPRDGPEANLK